MKHLLCADTAKYSTCIYLLIPFKQEAGIR